MLDEAAETLKSHPNVSVNVNGYCDAIGTVRYNLRLSERRANAVVRYLADHGVAEGRMSPHGYGKTNFVATNRTAEGRAQNRRSNWCRINNGCGYAAPSLAPRRRSRRINLLATRGVKLRASPGPRLLERDCPCN